LSAAVTFVTATYGKPLYLLEAAYSLFAQTRPDWVWWIVPNAPTQETEAVVRRLETMDDRIKVFNYPATERGRYAIYYPSAIANEYYPKIETPYFTWLSDDDMLGRRFVEKMAGELDKGTKHVVWGHLQAVAQGANGTTYRIPRYDILAQRPIGRDTGVDPCGKIDSGQILQTKESYNSLKGYKMPTNWGSAYHHDGIYMNHLATKYTFWPVDVVAVVHRRSSLATFKKG
jgi:hypothetical protein